MYNTKIWMRIVAWELHSHYKSFVSLAITSHSMHVESEKKKTQLKHSHFDKLSIIMWFDFATRTTNNQYIFILWYVPDRACAQCAFVSNQISRMNNTLKFKKKKKKKKISEKPNGGKKYDSNQQQKRTNMKWNIDGIEHVFSKIVSGTQEMETGRERKITKRDKKKLHHITINLMSVEMLFRRQKYRQFQQQQILHKLTAEESEKEQEKNPVICIENGKEEEKVYVISHGTHRSTQHICV